MSYFNHAFKKTFVATKATQAASGTPGDAAAVAGVTNGILVTSDIHVSNLKSTAATEGYQLGPGVTGLFDAKTDLSIRGSAIATGCCPFYIGSAAIKIDDKQGPFHGGYQESSKSKVINPKYMTQVYKVVGNAGSQAVFEVGGTSGNNEGLVGALLTLDNTTLSGGTGYTTATDVATTGGTGTGLTVDITVNTGVITAIAVNATGSGYVVGDTITVSTGNADATIDVDTVVVAGECVKEFLCGETYYLRVEVKGTSALRFANHNLYRNLDAAGGCCADPSAPVAVDPVVIYTQWAEQIANDPYLKDFIRPLLVVDGQAYAYNAADAAAEGLDPATELFTDAPATSTTAGMILKGAYEDTTFGTCTFQPSDYYGVAPIQMFISEVDLNGDPCTFGGVCAVERCPGLQANGTGEQKVRDLILAESYLQNFTHTDLRIREITQGTRVYEVLDKTAIYSSVYIQHSVPRFNNPSSTFDNDQYLLEVVGTSGMVTTLTAELQAIIDADCSGCVEIEDHTAVTTCDFTVPNPVA